MPVYLAFWTSGFLKGMISY